MSFLLSGCEDTVAMSSSFISLRDNQNEIAPGDDIVIECYISNTYCDQPPVWMRLVNNRYSLVSLESSNFVAFTEFNEQTCSWTSELEILDFTSLLAGEYACRHGNEINNITLEMGRKWS